MYFALHAFIAKWPPHHGGFLERLCSSPANLHSSGRQQSFCDLEQESGGAGCDFFTIWGHNIRRWQGLWAHAVDLASATRNSHATTRERATAARGDCRSTDRRICGTGLSVQEAMTATPSSTTILLIGFSSFSTKKTAYSEGTGLNVPFRFAMSSRVG